MNRPNQSFSHIKKGQAPGTLVYVGEGSSASIKIHLIQFNENEFKESFPENIEDLKKLIDTTYNNWINIDGVHDIKIVEEIGVFFSLENLALEDIANTHTRPKLDTYDDYTICIIKDLYIHQETILAEQISFILKEKILITFQEEAGDVFDAVRNRIRSQHNKIRQRGTDYLAYALIDAIVDNYFIITDHFDKQLDILEEELYRTTYKDQLKKIQHSKNNFSILKRAALPLREVVFSMYKSEELIFKKKTRIFIRDLVDHITHINENIEQSKDRVNGLMSIYLSGTSEIMNNIMKTLTIVSTIFMALSLIAGIYGMNFKYMPETEWRYGYFVVVSTMFILAVILFVFFRRKKWL